MGTVTFSTTVSVVNIPRKVGPAGWLDCITKAFNRGDVTVVNESKPRTARANLYRRVAAGRHRTVFGLGNSPNPVFVDRHKWRRLSGQVKRLHGRGPLFPVWPGFNEARSVTACAYRHHELGDTVPLMVVLGTHWVPNGRKVPEWWRKRARAKSERVLQRLIDLHTSVGRIVILAGDLNLRRPPNLRGVTWVQAGVDYIGVAVPRGVTVTDTDAHTLRARTDHKHVLWARFTFAHNPARQLVRV